MEELETNGFTVVPNVYNEDRLQTTLCVVEQLLNNRQLAAVSGDVSDLQALTPNHFLIGQANVIWPNCVFSGDNASFQKLFRE